jgi:hypothetical protein
MDKGTESLSTSADGTTRTASESIVEFRFGEDYFNPQFVEWLPLRILERSNRDMLSAYFWNNEEQKGEEYEFASLCLQRDRIRSQRQLLHPYQWNGQVSSPVNLEMIFQRIGVKKGSHLSPEDVVKKVDEAIGSWVQSNILSLHLDHWPHGWWRRTSQRLFEEASVVPFLAYLHDWFNSKQVIEAWRWGSQELNDALHATEIFLFRGRMGMFQQIGTIASQSVTEPTTTMTLTTFYTAGLKQGGAQDLRRMNEIINLLGTDNMVFASMQLPLNPDFVSMLGQSEEEVATNLASRIPALFLKDLIQSTEEPVEIIHQSQGILEEDVHFFQEYIDLFGQESLHPPPIEEDSSSSPSKHQEVGNGRKEWNWSLRFVLNKATCIRRGLTPDGIALRILDAGYHAEEEIHVFTSHPLEDRWILYFQFALPQIFEADPQGTRAKLWLLAERILSTLLMDGIRTIKSAKVTKLSTFTFDAEGKQESKDKFIVETHGSDLGALWQFPEIAWCQTVTNSIQDVLNEIGLEAAEFTIADQLEELLYHNNIHVDRRHLTLIAAVMTHSGTALPLTRFGFADKNPLEKISFEEPFSNLLHESLNARSDHLKGIIENITVGNTLPMGVNRVPKPINIDQSTKSIQERMKSLQHSLLTEKRHISRIWPKVSHTVNEKLRTLTMKARACRPTLPVVQEFLSTRLSQKKDTKASPWLRFSSTVLGEGKWQLTSYEYIFSELHISPRTYAWQIYWQQQSQRFKELPKQETDPTHASAPAAPSPSLEKPPRPPVPTFTIHTDSWSYLPSFQPQSEDFRYLSQTLNQPSATTTPITTLTMAGEEGTKKRKSIAPAILSPVEKKAKSFSSFLLPLPPVFVPTDTLKGEDTEAEKELMRKATELEQQQQAATLKLQITNFYLDQVPDYLGWT